MLVYGFIAQEIAEVLPHASSQVTDVLPNIYELVHVAQAHVLTFAKFSTSELESNATVLVVKGIDGQDHEVTLAEVIDEHSVRVVEDLSQWTGSVDAEGNIITETLTETFPADGLQSTEGYTPVISGYKNPAGNVTITCEQYDALADTAGFEPIINEYTKTTKVYPGDQLFVYGQKVSNFHTMDKQAIFTVATAALQEVDRQLQAERTKVATLESQVRLVNGQLQEERARVTSLETQLASVLRRLEALESAQTSTR